jgi:anionic cell wall polymer biosynthesis LytR-Cps2A-Psr (LCP) family protein
MKPFTEIRDRRDRLVPLTRDALSRVAGASESDTIVIVHVPAGHDRAYLVSIPRDSPVEIPPFPR